MYYEIQNTIFSMDNIQFIHYDEELYASGKGKGVFTISIYYTNDKHQVFYRVEPTTVKNFVKAFKDYINMD